MTGVLIIVVVIFIMVMVIVTQYHTIKEKNDQIYTLKHSKNKDIEMLLIHEGHISDNRITIFKDYDIAHKPGELEKYTKPFKPTDKL